MYNVCNIYTTGHPGAYCCPNFNKHNDIIILYYNTIILYCAILFNNKYVKEKKREY